MYPGAIQLLAAALFATCLLHSWRTEGQKYAQQWFGIGYLFSLLYQVLLVQLGVISYSDRMLQFGSAPTLISLLLPAVFYVAYVIANHLNPAGGSRTMLLLMFLLTPALYLPVDASAIAFDWWSFPSQPHSFLNGIPYFLPLSWGFNGALFYEFIRFVRGIRFRGSGQLFALILGTPLMTGLGMALVVAAQLFVALVGIVPDDWGLEISIGGLLLALPIAMAFRLSRTRFESR